VAKEELRLEVYRRLALVATRAEVDDVESEWLDRYGPVPEPARMLLTVALLRAECHRLGITELTISANQARISPIDLKVSESMRLKRLSRDAILKENLRQLIVPVPYRRDSGESDSSKVPGAAGYIVEFLGELFPIQSTD